MGKNDKHETACKKLASLHRKPFDSGKQRANGTDITYADIKKAQNEKAKNGGVFPRPQTNWRERHGNFIDAVSSSKRVDYALKTGAPLPPPPKTAVPSDYVQCEYCSRNFNAAAAERHIPFCREQSNRKQTGSLKSSAGSRTLSGNYRSLPTKQETRKEATSRNSSVERKTTTTSRGRDGSLSRARHDSSEDLNNRRKSLETRSQLSTAQANSRNTSLSAGMRPTLPPMTPSKRSSSGKREQQQQQQSSTPHQRLKTPVPLANRISKMSINH
uniref:C2HC/C3H-type domain-containing protein n=1 Tax=Caenorhabditis japonica TaxID=281687 RepID=A0A8R1IAQ5_CAEJA